MAQDIVELEWILPESGKDEQIRSIELAGGTAEDSGESYVPAPEEVADYPAAGFEPLTMIAVAATAVYVVQALMRTWRDRNVRGSVIVDTRAGKLRIRHVPSMPNGQLVIVEDGQTRVLDRQQENDGKALLEGLVSKFSK